MSEVLVNNEVIEGTSTFELSDQTGIMESLPEDNSAQEESSNQNSSISNEEGKQIKNVIEAYAKITTQYNGYELTYMSYSKYARSKNGEDVYIIDYRVGIPELPSGFTGFYYHRLVSLDSTNTRIEKKSDLYKGTLSGPSIELRYAYYEIWGK